MDPIIKRIRIELNDNTNSEIRNTPALLQGGDRVLGKKTATVIAIAKKYWK